MEPARKVSDSLQTITKVRSGKRLGIRVQASLKGGGDVTCEDYELDC